MLIPGNSLYLGSKGSLHQFVRTLAQELGPREILVNSLLPEHANTDLTSGTRPADSSQCLAVQTSREPVHCPELATLVNAGTRDC
jgi:NAD(P)-dependent dehydrogenase (short-subunit alcohol dehydrogenase family)